MRRLPHKLGSKEEEKAERQVPNWMKQGLNEPETGAWIALVVLVKIKMHSDLFESTIETETKVPDIVFILIPEFNYESLEFR